MKAVVAAFNQEKALVGAFSVITNLRMELFEAIVATPPSKVAVACFYVTLSLLTTLHQDGAQAEVRRGNRAAVDYRQCSIFMVSEHQGSRTCHHFCCDC